MCAFIYICMYALYEYIWIKLRETYDSDISVSPFIPKADD